MSETKYHAFAASYNAAVQEGAAAWRAGDMGHVDTVVARLGRVDAQRPDLVNRVALLGPEVGVAVLGAAQAKPPNVAAA